MCVCVCIYIYMYKVINFYKLFYNSNGVKKKTGSTIRK